MAQTFRGKISLDKAMRQKWCGRSRRFKQTFRGGWQTFRVFGVGRKELGGKSKVRKDGRGKDDGKREGRDGGEWRWGGIDN